jgi:hypothetical protein
VLVAFVQVKGHDARPPAHNPLVAGSSQAAPTAQAPLVAGMGGAGMDGNEIANEVQARTGYPTEAWDTGAQHIRVRHREVG